ncbi:MAG: FIST C-terminal domain-containing protein [Candidatus Sericytochromatia bacterium]|nr:FIST C-terminal domain-containing protein [Candidatus Sericytochromatia bacterium]
MNEKANVQIAYSQSNSIFSAVQDLKAQFWECEISLLIVFASSFYDQSLLLRALQNSFPETEILGCSTAGEVISDHFLQGSIVAMAFNKQILDDFHIEVVENLSEEFDLIPALKGFENHFGFALDHIDHHAYVGLVLIDGMAMMEEKFMESLGDKTNLIFIGGSAGDDLKFQETFVYAKGNVYANASILAILKPQNGFDVLKTQSFFSSGKHLTPTKVDPTTRTVFEFDGKPAAQAYAEALGVKIADLPSLFMRHPLGLMADGEPFVRSPQKLSGEALTFYCRIVEGVSLTILNPLDIVEDTQKALATKMAEIGPVQGIIDFQCILRTLQLREEGQTDAYAQLFKGFPMIGFSTYGEAYLGHMNQTSTMLIFK